MAIAITETRTTTYPAIRPTIGTTTNPTMARHITGIPGVEFTTATVITITTTVKLLNVARNQRAGPDVMSSQLFLPGKQCDRPASVPSLLRLSAMISQFY